MKRRQAKKIIKHIITFEVMYSNYQPYSMPQQIMAFSHINYPRDDIGLHLFHKVPIKYRFYDPVRIAMAMQSCNMQPSTAREYDTCMRRLL